MGDSMLSSKRMILSGILLFGTLILNSGCALKEYFVPNKHNEVSSKPVYQEESPVYYETTQEPELTISSTPIIEAECNDEVPVEENDCNRGQILEEELKVNNVKSSSQDVVHQLKSIQGQNITIGERPNGFTFPNYPGKVIILEMFGKDCPHCIKEIPIIKNIKKRYRGNLEIIAIQSQGRMGTYAAKNYINKYRINYPIIEGEDATNLQFFVQNTYGWTGILPYTLVIKDGVTEFSYPGEVSYKELKNDLDSLF